MATDTPFLNRILVAVSRGPVRMFRNSVGRGWVGSSKRFDKRETITVQPGDVLIRNARALHAGLCAGSGDLVGWVSVVVTPDMVGRKLAVFASAEAKQGTGRLEPDQVAWRDTVRMAGGIADEVRTVDDAKRLLDPASYRSSEN